METLKTLSIFFSSIHKDQRIGPFHVSIYSALLHYRALHGFEDPLKVFSHEIMPIAKIASDKTYHKCIRQLFEYGYIHYEPSFKKNQGSKIYLILEMQID